MVHCVQPMIEGICDRIDMPPSGIAANRTSILISATCSLLLME